MAALKGRVGKDSSASAGAGAKSSTSLAAIKGKRDKSQGVK